MPQLAQMAAPNLTDWFLYAFLHTMVYFLKFFRSVFVVYVQYIKRYGLLSLELNIL